MYCALLLLAAAAAADDDDDDDDGYVSFLGFGAKKSGRKSHFFFIGKHKNFLLSIVLLVYMRQTLENPFT